MLFGYNWVKWFTIWNTCKETADMRIKIVWFKARIQTHFNTESCLQTEGTVKYLQRSLQARLKQNPLRNHLHRFTYHQSFTYLHTFWCQTSSEKLHWRWTNCSASLRDKWHVPWSMSHLWGWRRSLLNEKDSDCKISPSLYNCSRVN